MTHHHAARRPRAARESVPYYIAREVFIWNVPAHPDDYAFSAQLEPGDMALNEAGDVYMYTGNRWHILISSDPVDGSDESEVKSLTTTPAPARLRVTHETES